jgi:hypothetical protein
MSSVSLLLRSLRTRLQADELVRWLGIPQTASEIADKIGRIMNYGDGIYGGIFIAALYSGAYFE